MKNKRRLQKLRWAAGNRKRQNPAEIILLGRIYELNLPAPKWQCVVQGFIVDFAWSSAQLIVEVDGAYHDTERQRRLDADRQGVLERAGWSVIRITDATIRANPGQVVEIVRAALDASTVSVCPVMKTEPVPYKLYAPIWWTSKRPRPRPALMSAADLPRPRLIR